MTAVRAFYNDTDPFVCEWMRTLIARGHLAPGSVDDRSIKALSPDDVAGRGQRHFFAGIGGWSRALRLAGIPDDADVWTGSCPCQPFSDADAHTTSDSDVGEGIGVRDPRHLWPTWFELIRECQPPTIFGEQVASRDGLAWLDLVRADLEGCGYAFGASDLCVAGVGAPHIRQRLWFVATRGLGDAGRYRDRQHARELPRDESEHDRRAADGDHAPVDPGAARDFWSPADWLPCSDGVARPVEPGTFPMASGIPARVGRLRAYGNSIPPEVAATFIRASLEAITESR